MKNLLLLSGSSYKSTTYLQHCKNWINNFLEDNRVLNDEILFIPFAGVRKNNDEYEKRVKDCLDNDNIISIHHFNDKIKAVKNSKIICIGGGNTFMLLSYLYKYDLLEAIREAVNNGAVYFGWSAGSNVAGKTIMTTNDMPIIMPKSFESLNLISYHINPHFISGKIPGHNGESREERLEEFLIANKNEAVLALPEGSGIKVSGDLAEVIGYCDILKFSYQNIKTIKCGSNIKIDV